MSEKNNVLDEDYFEDQNKILKITKQMDRSIDMQKAAKKLLNNSSESLNGKRGDRQSLHAISYYEKNMDGVPEKMIKEGNEITQRDLKKGKLFTQKEVDRVKNAQNIDNILKKHKDNLKDRAGSSGKGSSLFKLVREVKKGKNEFGRDLFEEQKVEVTGGRSGYEPDKTKKLYQSKKKDIGKH